MHLNLTNVLLGNSIVNVKDHVDDTYAQATSKAFSILKDCVSEFASHSDVLMSALDQVGVIFPFIGGSWSIIWRRATTDQLRSRHHSVQDSYQFRDETSRQR
jgi:hypothetical protein